MQQILVFPFYREGNRDHEVKQGYIKLETQELYLRSSAFAAWHWVFNTSI